MTIIINPQEINLILEEYRGAFAKIWSFNVSHKKLILRLLLADKEEVAYIISVSSEYIIGPFSWEDANLSIVEDISNETSEPIAKAIDKGVGFELISSGGIILALGLEEELNGKRQGGTNCYIAILGINKQDEKY